MNYYLFEKFNKTVVYLDFSKISNWLMLLDYVELDNFSPIWLYSLLSSIIWKLFILKEVI